MPKETLPQHSYDYLFIGEELDTPAHERERIERLTRFCVLTHQLHAKNGSVDASRSGRAALLASDTRNSLKKVNGQDLEEEEDGTDEESLEDDATEAVFLDIERPNANVLMSRVQHFREIKRSHDEVEAGHFEPLPSNRRL